MTLAEDDPFSWLEDVLGEPALDWVRRRNARTEQQLEAVAGHEARRLAIQQVLDAADRIPVVHRAGDWFYNLWQDTEHPRGLWRRTGWAGYCQASPDWHTVLDLDALAATEGENWVWHGTRWLGPAYRRCLIALSRGGADAHVVREFDVEAGSFVADGFVVPEAKSELTWLDADTVFIASDFGPGSLTDSGYPRIVKRWRRGQRLADAATVFEGEHGDVSVYAWVDHTPGHERSGFGRFTGFYTSRAWVLQGGQALAIDKPDDAAFTFWRSHVLIQLRSDWALEGRTWPRGSLLVADATAYLQGRRDLVALFTPTPKRALQGFTQTRSVVLLDISDSVGSRIEEWRLHDGRWQGHEVTSAPHGSLAVTALHDPQVADDPHAEDYWLQASSFLEPDALDLARTGGTARQHVKQLPAFFDAAAMRVEQRFARSRDGTEVPYFLVWPAGTRADGNNPTLLYGYGGFEVSYTPWYLAVQGRTWLGAGGVFVVANIRGGGEFGPAWHQAAVRSGRQRSYDDFAAVAEDLIRTGVTRPARLGIQGGSNGGLLVAAVMLQRPELFGAVVCQVPLLDMRRYHRLLAGASWIDEYGDPDRAEDWGVIARYSPYHNVRAEMSLPPVLFTTSTRDDRVHPGHARKMAARMLEQGHRVLYWENVEGGHGGAADNAQRARMRALETSFLWRELAGR